jgi:hypothetical protein
MKTLESLAIFTRSTQNSPLSAPSNSPSFFKFINIKSRKIFLNKFRFVDLALKIVSLKCFLARCIFFTGMFSVFTRVAFADTAAAFDDNSFYSKGSDLVHNIENNVADDAVVADNVNFNSDYYNILDNKQSYNSRSSEPKEDKPSKASDGGFKHLARVESGAKISAQRNIGDGKILVPIYQTTEGDQLLFTDIRGRFDNLGSSEYNIGLGYRKLLNDTGFLWQNQWIIGAYGFFDHLTSANKNSFNQATFGVESLSEEFDFRTNIYLPQSKEATIPDTVAAGQGHGRFSVEYQKEKPLKGVDFEVGYKLPIKFATTKVFAGGYHYKGDHQYKSITGSKYRAEVTFDKSNVEMLPKNMEVTLGGEYQYDKVRGGKSSGVIRLSYQFGVFDNDDKNSDANRGSDIRSRMNEFLIRDIDVVTNTGAFSEKAYGELEGISNREVYIIDSTTNLKNTIESAPNNSLIILDGAKGDFTVEAETNLKPGQIISGQRDSLVISASGIGKSFNVKLHTSKARIVTKADLSNNHLIGLNDNTEIENLDIYFDAGQGQKFLTSGSAKIINVDGKSNVIISKVGIASNYYDNGEQANDATAIYVNNSSNVTIVGNNSNSQSDISGYKNAVEINNAKGSVNISGLNTSNNKGVGIVVNDTENINLNNINSNYNSKGIKINNSGIVNLIGQVNLNNNSASGIEVTEVDNLNNYSNLNANYNHIDGIKINCSRINNFANFNASNNAGNGIVLNRVNGSNFGNINVNNNATGLRFTNSGDLVANSVSANGNRVGIDIRVVKNVNIQNVITNDNQTAIQVDDASLPEINLFN